MFSLGLSAFYKLKEKFPSFRILAIGYYLIIIGLFLYSFTQVDLGLTLSRLSIWQVVEKFFQHIGYFDRPLSAALYIVILIFLFSFYLLFLLLAEKNKITKRQVWFLVIGTAVILTLSYNAFSYDIFNYIFDAKIITHYHQNPYLHKALDYPHDPMLSFMHWTQRTYPYGPFWLVLTVPLSFLGLNFFLPTLFLFKLLSSLSFFGTVYIIGKIIRKIYPEREIFSLILFGLNPLVIIESLVSAHNDTPMMFFAVLSIYLILYKKYLRSLLVFIISIGIKFATAFLAPILIAIYFFQKRKIESCYNFIFTLTSVLMIVPIVIASIRTNFQPWYLLYALPFTALAPRKFYIVIPVVLMSFFSLLEYVPFLYRGDWNSPVPQILFWLTAIGIVASVAAVSLFYVKIKKTYVS